jgi:hypothetical protein
MEDPNLIAYLYPYGEGKDEGGPAHLTIQHARNRSQYVETQLTWERGSREPTASTEDFPSLSEGLSLTFSNGPKSDKGFTFGNLGRRSDIPLPNLDNHISRCHAYLTFDPQGRCLILRDCSTCGTVVTYDGQGGKKRRNFQWILSGHRVPDQTKEIVIEFHPRLRFQIIVCKYEKHRDQYFNNIDQFLATVAANAVIPIGGLGLESGNSTVVPSGTQSPSEDSILIKQEKLGEGSFAIVELVWDVSTGIRYAAKKAHYGKRFNRKRWEAEIKIMKQIQHVSLSIRFEEFSTKILIGAYYSIRIWHGHTLAPNSYGIPPSWKP